MIAAEEGFRGRAEQDQPSRTQIYQSHRKGNGTPKRFVHRDHNDCGNFPLAVWVGFHCRNLPTLNVSEGSRKKPSFVHTVATCQSSEANKPRRELKTNTAATKAAFRPHVHPPPTDAPIMFLGDFPAIAMIFGRDSETGKLEARPRLACWPACGCLAPPGVSMRGKWR